MHCELYIPDFFPREEPQRAEGLECAETLIARGRRRRAAPVSREAWLFGRFGVAKQRDWPVAPYTLLADGGAPGPHHWIRAHPGHLAGGEPALNSIWFWGGGVIGGAKARPFSAVIADDPLAQGLALAAGIPALALPRDAGSALAALGGEGRVLVVFDAPREAQLRGRSAALERDWFLPLIASLKSRRIGMLTLYLCGADSLLEVETVRSDLRYFWRLR